MAVLIVHNALRGLGTFDRLLKAAALAIVLAPGGAPGQQITEYEMKAQFLGHFTRFVQWPAKALPKSDQPFVIGLVGFDPFGSILDERMKDKTVEGRKIVVRRYAWGQSLDECRIVFLSAAGSSKIDRLLAATRGRPILTVGESDQFAQMGGMISLGVRNKCAHLEINLGAARAAELTLRSQLLQNAATVIDNRRGGGRL